MECVILAGGRGQRMSPATDHLPKCLLTVAGRPFADWQLEWLVGEGVDRVVYSIGYLGDLVRQHIGDGRRYGLDVEYVDEGDRPLGTAGALRLAADRHALGPTPFVLYGDSYLSISLAAVERTFATQSAPVLMTVYRDTEELDRPNVVFTGHRVTRYEKGVAEPPRDMVYTDYGLSLWQRSAILEMIPPGIPADLATVFTDLSLAGRLAGYEARERFYEIGSARGRRQLDDRLQGAARGDDRRPGRPGPTGGE